MLNSFFKKISPLPTLRSGPFSFSLWPHLAGMALLSLVLVGSFLEPPGIGDDAQYWAIADQSRDLGWQIFNATDFHNLRWPVWGVCLVSQWISGPGVANYYAGPFLYITLGSLFAFCLAWHLTGRHWVAWIAGLAYVMHPLLDEIHSRPMPDLSEGLFIGAAFWLAIHWLSKERPGKWDWLVGLASGLVIGLAHSNRFTGLLTLPVILLSTLILFPGRSIRLLPVLAGTILFIGAEGLIFQHITGDFWHSLHANMGAKGRSGTEPLSLWKFPFRFLKDLWMASFLEPFYFFAALGGSVLFWLRGQKKHRAQVLWLVILYLGYSCAVQSFHPPQPLLREGARFLGSLALPMSVLGAAGLLWAAHEFRARRPFSLLLNLPLGKPLAFGILALFLFSCSQRTLTDMGYVPPLKAQLDSLPDGTLVLTHNRFLSIARMVSPEKTGRLRWTKANNILKPGKVDDDGAEAIMYCRKLMWLTLRKSLEKNKGPENTDFPVFFDRPWEKWTLRNVLLEGENSDFVFLTRRRADDPPARVWENGSLPAEFLAAGLDLPYRETVSNKRFVSADIDIPANWRGKHLWIDVEGSSDVVEPIQYLQLIWLNNEGKSIFRQREMLYFHQKTGHDFNALAIPVDATKVRLKASLKKISGRLEINGLRVYLQE